MTYTVHKPYGILFVPTKEHGMGEPCWISVSYPSAIFAASTLRRPIRVPAGTCTPKSPVPRGGLWKRWLRRRRRKGERVTVQIVEILGRSVQGVTSPFYCRGENGQAYFVKGRGAGRQSLIAEYVGGKLAHAFGLPVPEFEIVEVPQELIRWCGRDDAHELGAGQAFGSKELPHVQEFSFSLIPQVPEQVRKDVAVFDWWLHNADRTLTEKGGNPNLLWNLECSCLAVIDHNQAFATDFSPRNFAELHVFHQDFLKLADDWVERETYANRLSAVFAGFDLACDNVPTEWWVENGVPALFNREAAKALLNRYVEDNFWRIA